MVIKGFKDIVGQRFGRLVVLNRAGSKRRRAAWLTRCDCGVELLRVSQELVSGKTRSCGCLRIKHGEGSSRGKRSPEYRAWKGMKARCYSKSATGYENYGGRGIRVCRRWRNSFENFLADMGRKPGERFSLDRLDSNKDYSKDNCRWATFFEQNQNRRGTHVVIFRGELMVAAEVARRLGRNKHLLTDRARNTGCSIQEASDFFEKKYGKKDD